MFVPTKRRPANAKLTEAQVRVIKQDLKDYHEGRSGDSPGAIANMLGICAETIRRIDRGETWGWVQLDSEENLAAALAVPPTPEEEAKVNQIAKEMFEWEQKRKASATAKMLESITEVKRPDRLIDDIEKS